jgi:hypothetical protein
MPAPAESSFHDSTREGVDVLLTVKQQLKPEIDLPLAQIRSAGIFRRKGTAECWEIWA